MHEAQSRIAAELGVDPHFDAPAQIARRTQFLVEYARAATAESLVLGCVFQPIVDGISG